MDKDFEPEEDEELSFGLDDEELIEVEDNGQTSNAYLHGLTKVTSVVDRHFFIRWLYYSIQ